MLIQQRFIKFPCFVIFFLYDSMIRKLCLSWHQKGIWQCTSEAKGTGRLHLTGSAVSAASWDTLQTTPKTSPSEQIETPIIGDVPGYYVHSPLRWLLIYFYIRNKKLQLTNSVLNTRHDLYQLLNAIWTMLKCIIYF